MLVIVTAVLMLQTICYFGSMVRMGRDVMTSLQTGDFYGYRVRAVRGWTMALFIHQLLTALGSGTMESPLILSTGLAKAAVYLLMFLWTGRCFIPRHRYSQSLLPFTDSRLFSKTEWTHLITE